MYPRYPAWSTRGSLRAATRLTVLCACGLVLSLSACEDISWPFHRDSASVAPVAPSGGDAAADKKAQCANIRAQIRSNEESQREAPATSVSASIVESSQARAQKHIDDLTAQYDDLDCPDDSATDTPARLPPIQPAPGGNIP